jgi:DeoR family transcriptional regulator, suf operon transcriptional repressor
MSSSKLHSEFLESGRGRIIGVLRPGSATVEEIAAKLRVTGNAVRAHLVSLERDGLVRPAGMQPGATRPSRTYELTPELDHLLSRAYIPLLTQLVRLFAARESAPKFDAIMREAGRGLASEIATAFPTGALQDRVAAASQVLNRELGASTDVEKKRSGYVIQGSGCPLAALTGKHPGVCHAIESLLAEMLQTSVHECCDRSDRPRCCFEISASSKRGGRARSSAQ